jgi:hypothetical protein
LLATMTATVPLSAFLLTTLHFVPFFERLVLWIVPALYVGVTLLADRALHSDRDSARAVRPTRDTTRAAAAFIVRAVVFAIAAGIVTDVAFRGVGDARARPTTTNHLLDDRGAVRWLAAREQPGDVWVTTHLALPAIWWYAADGRVTRDTTIVEVGYVDPGADCDRGALARALDGAQRALVFTGFHFDDVPKPFDDLLMERLADVGQMTAYRGFGDVSRAAIVDLRLTSRHDVAAQVPGCLSARPARRW